MFRLLMVLLSVLPGVALAGGMGAPLSGLRRVVNSGPGNQFEPHVSGSRVVYTHKAQGMSEVRWHELSTGQEGTIPGSSAYDVVADVSGDSVVFTRVLLTSAIFTYDLKKGGPAVEIAPQMGAHRRGAVIGHRTLVWQDYSFEPRALQPEIATFDLETGVLTRLTNDSLLDRSPAVSADGRVIVWTKCVRETACDIWMAVAGKEGFETRALTGSQGDESQPQTNGQVVVYTSTRLEQGLPTQDIYWQAVGGGPEYRLALPGLDANPMLSGSLMAFERQDPSARGLNTDIMLFDMKTQTLYALTATLRSEHLNDISVDENGLVHVLWSTQENGFDVRALTFQLPGGPEEDAPPLLPTPEEVCAEPGSRALLSSVTLRRFSGAPQKFQALFPASGKGLLCVDNGYAGVATSLGWVKINDIAVLEPQAFQRESPLVAQRVTMDGRVRLEAIIDGPSGGSFRMRLYADPEGTPRGQDPFEGDELFLGTSVMPQVWVPSGPRGAVVVEETSEVARAGCSQGGSGLFTLGVLLGMAFWAWPRRVPVPARPRRSSRTAR
ncbi:hypothetical protein POL68_06600 [Stigmatella sp. ncwal1]|uniref:WD40-like Beta Propeller Repeat n=1 Tax=Stigmatella ashevillensis TaxID=2995309 RepID=A0ABT5D4T5_9BACT|nr:hypothetical protein [Stigmatella ashevillena]MDC0708133.1 hypothetical protein [Stigmatella ashevillena]